MKKAAVPVKAPASDSGASANDLRFRSQFRKTELCAFFGRGWCSKGDRCEFAHGDHEVQAVPDLTKTSLCRKWLKKTCKHATEQCPFAHGAHELRVTEAYAKKFAPDGAHGPLARQLVHPGSSGHPFPFAVPTFTEDGALMQMLIHQHGQHLVDPRLWAMFAPPFLAPFPYGLPAFENIRRLGEDDEEEDDVEEEGEKEGDGVVKDVEEEGMQVPLRADQVPELHQAAVARNVYKEPCAAATSGAQLGQPLGSADATLADPVIVPSPAWSESLPKFKPAGDA